MSSMNEPRTDAQGLPVLFSGGLSPSGEVGSYRYAQGHPKFGQQFDPADDPKNRSLSPSQTQALAMMGPSGTEMMRPSRTGGPGGRFQQPQQIQQRLNPMQIEDNELRMQQQMLLMKGPRQYGDGPGFAKPLSPNPGTPQQGGAGGAPTSWKMSIEPMAGGGMIPGYQEGGDLNWLERRGQRRQRERSNTALNRRLLSLKDEIVGGDEIDLSILDQAIPKRDMSASLVDTSMLDRDISIPDHMVDMVEQARFEDMMGQSIPKRDMLASLVDTSMMDRDVSIPDYMVDMVQQARFEDMGGQSVAKRDMRDQLGTGLPPGARRLNSDPSQYDGIPIDMPDVHPLSYIENLIYDGPPSLTPNRRVNEVEAGQLPGDLRRQAAELAEVRDSLSRPQEIYPFTGSGPRTGGLAELLRYGNQPGQGVRRAYGGIIGLEGGGYIPMYAQGGHIPGYGFGGFLRGLGKVVSKVAPVAMNFIPGLSGLSGLAKAGIGALAKGAGDLANDRGLNLDSMLGGAGRAYALSSGIDRVRDLDSLQGEGLWGGLRKVLTDRDIGSEAMGEFANIPFGEATALAIAEQAGERGRQQQAAEEGGYEPGQANPMGASGRVMPGRIMPGRGTTASAVGVPSTGGSLQYADDMNYGTQTNADGGLISGYSAGGRFNEGMEEFLPDTMARWQDPKKKVDNRPPVPGYQSGGSFQEKHPGLTYSQSGGWWKNGKQVQHSKLPKEVLALYKGGGGGKGWGTERPGGKGFFSIKKNAVGFLKGYEDHKQRAIVNARKYRQEQANYKRTGEWKRDHMGKVKEGGFYPSPEDFDAKYRGHGISKEDIDDRLKTAQFAAGDERTKTAMTREWEDNKDLTGTTQGRIDSFLSENFGTPIPDRAPNKEQVARTRQREDEDFDRMAVPYSERNTGPEPSAEQIRANVRGSHVGTGINDMSGRSYQEALNAARTRVSQVLDPGFARNEREHIRGGVAGPGYKNAAEQREALEAQYGDLDKFLANTTTKATGQGEPGQSYVDFHDGRGPITKEEAYPDGVPKYDPRLNPGSVPPPPEPTPFDPTDMPGPNVYPPSISTGDPGGQWQPTRIMPGGDSATMPDGRLLTPGFDPNSNRIKQIHGPGGVEPSARDSTDMGSGFYGEKKWFDPNAADPAERDIGGFNPHDLPKTANEFAAAGDTAGANLLEHLNAPAAPLQNYLNPAPVPGSAEGGLIEQIPTEDIQKLVRAVQQIESPGSQQIIEVAIQDHGLEAVKRIITLIQEQGPMTAGGDPQFAARGGLINGGGGDAMADDIFVDAEMGSNGEKQTIAVSAGEYIIPGDVVGHLGSGATGGGANVLDQFVEDVRINRTGSPEQPGPIDLSDVLPGTYGERYA
jgi:hypothetical protein